MTAHKRHILMEQVKDKSLPFWLQDWTRNTKLNKIRPQSWRPPNSEKIIDEQQRAITTPARFDSLVSLPLAFHECEEINDMPTKEEEENYSKHQDDGDASSTKVDSPETLTPVESIDSVESVLSFLDEEFGELTLPATNNRNSSALSMSDDRYTPSVMSIGDTRSRSRRSSGCANKPLINYSTNTPSIIGKDDISEPDLKLEESWSSLDVFNQKHRGRLSKRNDEFQAKFSDFDEFENQLFNHLPPKSPRIKEDFIIPELPAGKHLVLDITSTWGDRHYVGLNGIEIFSITGELVQVSQIVADPADINVLPEYDKDPRVVDNLLDRINRTRDDMHLWLTPFTEGNHHYIKIELEQTQTIAMIRIWNYNKSRIHSYRGVKDMVITLDGCKIFQGEIARASGAMVGGTDAFGDTILFTMDEEILERVSRYDDSFDSFMNEVVEPVKNVQPERPLTADVGDVRPLTGFGKPEMNEQVGAVLCLRTLSVKLLNTWGLNIIGLTGLQILGETGEPLQVANILTEVEYESKQIMRLVDGINETTDRRHMWRTDFNGSPLELRVFVNVPVHISAIVLWNYNESEDLSYAGVKNLAIYIDDKIVCGDVLVRKAPGHVHYRILQKIPLIKLNGNNTRPGDALIKTLLNSRGPISFEEYVPPEMPSGFVFQFQLLSTWGDPYYIGLNGIEMYDVNGQLIPISESHISAHPSSVNILDGIEDDVRTPDKLVDGINNTVDGRHMWLAPILPGIINTIYVVFDVLTTISIIKLWNYGKTYMRCVKEFGILVDDLLIYNGILEATGPEENGIPHRTVIFSRDMEFTRKQRNITIKNRNSIDAGRNSFISADQSKRPFTSLQLPMDFSRSRSVLDF